MPENETERELYNRQSLSELLTCFDTLRVGRRAAIRIDRIHEDGGLMLCFNLVSNPDSETPVLARVYESREKVQERPDIDLALLRQEVANVITWSKENEARVAHIEVFFPNQSHFILGDLAKITWSAYRGVLSLGDVNKWLIPSSLLA